MNESKKVQKELAFEVSVSEHCNLNCQMCDHFSPLSNTSNLTKEEAQIYFQRLSLLSNGKATYVRLLGGEPLLNPELVDIMKITRNNFSFSRIELYTNGILLSKLPDMFFNVCSQLNITIVITKYPIKLDYQEIELILNSFKINFCYANTKPIKTSFHVPLDPSGGQDMITNFEKCTYANNCIFFKKGKLYTCPIAPNINIFNDYFQETLPIHKNDGISIFETDNLEEIMNFLDKPINFCKYCYVTKRTAGHKWKTSTKTKKEWLI